MPRETTPRVEEVERWIGFARTLGRMLSVHDLGLSETELGPAALRQATEQTLGNRDLSWYVSYRVCMGVQ